MDGVERTVTDHDLQILWKARPGSNTAHAKGYGARNFIALCSVDLTVHLRDPGRRSRRCIGCRKARAQLAAEFLAAADKPMPHDG